MNAGIPASFFTARSQHRRVAAVGARKTGIEQLLPRCARTGGKRGVVQGAGIDAHVQPRALHPCAEAEAGDAKVAGRRCVRLAQKALQQLQALCLDVRVLDRDGEEVELKDEEEDGFTPDRRPNQDFDYASDEGEFAAHGFTTGRMEADGNVVADFEEGALFIDESSKDESTDNED